jgi:hypothetical protein
VAKSNNPPFSRGIFRFFTKLKNPSWQELAGT